MEEQKPMTMVPRARAIRAIREWIASGALGQGETLPSERALAAKLEVGRATVRRALQVLQAEGLILDHGGHVRTVMAAAKPGEGLMRRMIAIALPCEGTFRELEQAGWMGLVALGAMDEARGAGLHVLMLEPGGLGTEELEQLVAERPMGVIAAEETGKAVIEATARAAIPVVVWGDGPGVEGFDRVASDEEMGTFELTKWIIGQGKRRILTLWNGSTQGHAVQGRLRGYERAMREAGLEPMGAVEMPRVQVNDQQQFEAMMRMTAGYLAQYLTGANPVDAIMTGSDQEAVAVGAACRILGKDVGREVMVAGYGNEDTDAKGGIQATVDQKKLEMGRELVKLLMERVGGKLPKETQRRVIKPRVVVLNEQERQEEKPSAPAEPPVLVSVLQQEREGKSEPLFGWKMEGGRWMLGKRQGSGGRGQRSGE
ncbi:MAG: GntR family transcriptional regulator [Bacillota bacterium]